MVVGREVEVYTDWADHPPDRHRYGAGSGYLLAGRLVLTAAHVVCPAGTMYPGVHVQVRAPDGPGLFGATTVWRHPDPGVDVAVLEVTDPAWTAPVWRHPVRFGRLVTTRARQPCEATGFPAVVATPQVRDSHTADGVLHPKGLAKAGRLAVEVSNPPAPPTEEETAGEGSWWAGMSGAGVLAAGLVVGVVTTDPRGFDSRRLVAVPIAGCAADAGFAALVAAHTGAGVVVEAVELAGMAEPVPEPDSPAGLLRADTADTPFRSRPELALLHDWCADSAGLPIRLVVGPGGQGKTRLARHLAAELAGRGWATLILADTTPPEQLAVLGEVAVPTLVVVDYAETRAAQFEVLIAALRAAPEKTRLLLLARTAGEWRTDWVGPSQQLRVLADDRIVIELGPVDPDPGGRTHAWEEAVAALAPRLGGLDGYRDTAWSDIAATVVAPVLDGPRYRTILAVQMHALATLLDAEQPAAAASSSTGGGVGVGHPIPGGVGGGGGAAQVLLGHESGYWTRVADRFGITLAPATRRCLVATAALWGAATPADAHRVLAAALPDADRNTRSHTADWLATLYRDGERYWAGLQPDRLAEDLIATALAPDGRCPDLIDDTIAAASAGQLEHGLTVLGRAQPLHPHLTDTITAAVLGAGVAGGVAAIVVASRLDTPQPVLIALARLIEAADLPVLRALYNALPRFSLLLGPTSVLLSTTLVARYRAVVESDRDAYLPALAQSVGNLAVHLAAAGRRAEGLTAAQESVAIYRDLAELDRDAYLPDLAAAMTNHSLRLWEVGQRQQTVPISREAVDIYRELVELDRGAYLPDLAAALTNHAALLAGAGQRQQTVPISQEAVDIYRELVELDRGAYLPDLAAALTNHGLRLWEVGQRQQTVPISREAVDIYRELVELNRDAYLADLAAALTNHGALLARAGQRQQAATISREAVDTYRHLVALNRDAYLHYLAMSLTLYALRLGEVSQHQQAIPISQEAVETYRELVVLNRDAHLADLAAALTNHGALLAGAGQRQQAATISREAVETYRQVVKLNRAAHLANLAWSLTLYALRLGEVGQHQNALPIAREAVDTYRQLVVLNRDAHLPDLTAALHNHAALLAGAGEHQQAVPISQEAVDLRRELVELNRDAHLPNLSASVYNLAIRLAEAGRRAEALVAGQEASSLYHELARAEPEIFGAAANDADRLVAELR